MFKRSLQFLLLAIALGSAPLVAVSGGIGEGYGLAVKGYGLSELVAAAKRSDPNSNLPFFIEYMLTGLSMATDPKTTLEAIYPGALAASAISQLIEKHGKDIANMTYTERKVFIGGAYGDPSLIPKDDNIGKPDKGDALCRDMFNVEDSAVAECIRYVRNIQRCNANRKPSSLDIKHCNGYLSEFYEHMQFVGKNKLVREAGKIAATEFARVKNSSENQVVPDQNEGRTDVSFAGNWKTNWGIVKLDGSGGGSYPHDKGKISGSVNGRVLTGTWSEAPSYSPPRDAGDVEFTLSTDGNSISGKWRYGSQGNWRFDWNGQRVK